jgi:tRNA-specific 2-thiouridylase
MTTPSPAIRAVSALPSARHIARPPAHTGTIVVGVSGGVDSAVALMRLRDQGAAVRAVFMKNWDEDDADGHCPAARDLADARAVCARLDLALSTVNFSHEYWERVFVGFLDEHRRGRTPNPDVTCNQELKFRAFLDYAGDLGATCIATGHYARTVHARDGWRLLRARDEDKDQSYFLHRLDQSQLARARFPLGDLDKREVRRLAREAGLPVHAKKDSTGICFIGERPFTAFLARYLNADPGVMETPGGVSVGTHRGLAFYTIGQRQGLGIGGRANDSGEPWYVAGKDLARNVLIVVQGRAHPALHARGLRSEPAHWIAGHAPALPLSCHARIRHRQPLQACRVTALAGDALEVRFEQPQWAVTPGQSVVFYDDRICLGGARIDAAMP